MKTGNISFERGLYKKIGENGNLTTYDFELQNKNVRANNLFTDIVRIELDNGYHDRSRFFDYWIYFKNDAWVRCPKSGLAKTDIKGIFEGNISRQLDIQARNEKGKMFEVEQHLIIVYLHDNFDTVVIDLFENFYIRKKSLLHLFIGEHFKTHYINKGR